MFERLILAAATTATTAAAGTAEPFNQYGWVGALMPPLIGIIMVIISRAIVDMNSPKKRTWDYNLLVMALCSIFTGVFVHEWALTAGQACLFGMFTGMTGIGIMSWGKPMLTAFLDKALAGLKTPPTSE